MTTTGHVSYRNVLRIPDFRRLVVGAGASQIGDWLYNVALLVYVFQATQSAAWVSAATLGRLLPYVVLAPIGGLVADRFERLTVLVASDVARALLMSLLALAVLAEAPVALVILLAMLTTAAGVAARPAALAAIPSVVGEGNLAPANALLHTVQDVGVVGGPALGAVLLAVGSPAAAFGFNALSFLVSGVAAASITTRSRGLRTEGPAPSAAALLVDGLRAARATPYVPVLTVLCVLGAMTYGAQTVQLVLYADSRLGLGADGYGYLLGASGAGGVLGAAVSNRLAARSRIAVVLAVAGVAFVGSQFVYAGVSLPAVAIATGVVAGLGMVVSDVVSEVAITRATTNEVMGRIFGALDGIAVGAMVLGAVVAAPLVSLVGLTTSFLVLGGVAVGGTLACLPVLLRLDRATAAQTDALAPVVAALSRLAIFTGASRAALEQLAGAAIRLPVAAGTEVVVEGEPADAFYVVTAGRLAVTSTGERGAARYLRELGAGDYFGEIGLVERIPRTATVTAVDGGEVLRIDGAAFLDALSSNPAGVQSLSDGVSRGLALTHPSRILGRDADALTAVPRQAGPVEDRTPVG